MQDEVRRRLTWIRLFEETHDVGLVCCRCGISGPTFRKWLRRYEEQVEAALISHPAVLEAAVVGHEDAEQLVKPYAFVVLKDGQQPSDALADELKQHVKTTLQPHKYPRWVVFVAELPKTATGKTQRYLLREQLAGE